MKHLITGIVLKNETIAKNILLCNIEAPVIARASKPGQFVNIYFPDSVKIFPRPFSVAGVDDDQIMLLYKVIGSQTELMSQWAPNRRIQLLGPLGNSFHYGDKNCEYVLLAGGVGAAPLMFLRDQLYNRGIMPKFFLGAKTKEQLPFIEDKKSELRLSTDDGSAGAKGLVTELLLSYLENASYAVRLFSCGPDTMLTALQKMNFPDNVDVSVSLERIMACGLGLCQGCIVCNRSQVPGNHYSLVCKDGPVFKLREIDVDD